MESESPTGNAATFTSYGIAVFRLLEVCGSFIATGRLQEPLQDHPNIYICVSVFIISVNCSLL